MSKNVINVMVALFASMVFVIAGCGGGSSSGTLPGNVTPLTVSGTASEGALIVGKTVKLKDANGKSAPDGTTDSTTGFYSIDVTGLTAPFLVAVTGTNGTYVSLAQTAGTANINPITTTVVALAAGTSDVSALFTNLKTTELTAINNNHAAKSALVTSSLQAALPSGIKAEDYFTGTITAGKGMDAVFDTYQIAINPTDGITIKTKDANATTVLTIPASTVTANSNQPLPTIITATSWTVAMVSGKAFYSTDNNGSSFTLLTFAINGSLYAGTIKYGTWSIEAANLGGRLVIKKATGADEYLTLTKYEGVGKDIMADKKVDTLSYNMKLNSAILPPFTMAMVSGKAFNANANDGNPSSLLTFRADGVFLVDSVTEGTWSIDASGRLVIQEASGNVNTLAITTTTGAVITAYNEIYDKINGDSSAMMTLTAVTPPPVFSAAMVSGKSFNANANDGNPSSLLTFRADGVFLVDSATEGTWSIDASGRLVINQASGDVNTLVLSTTTGAVITAYNVIKNAATPSDLGTSSMTLTAIN